MYLEELSLVNFRNLARQNLKFKKAVAVFGGDNAQGKTNLLEAIYLLSTAKSFRTREGHELITWGETEAKVSGQAEHLQLELVIKPISKELRINKQAKRLTDIIGEFVTVLFTPSDVGLVSGGPSERRRFLDHLGALSSKEYLAQLVALQQIIKARNQALWKISFGGKDDLWVWDEQLAKAAGFIWHFRLQIVGALNEKLKNLGKKLLQGSLQIEYSPPFAGSTAQEKAATFQKHLERTRPEEVNKKQTLSGPQRDNFKLILEELQEERVISKDLGIYGSRGEQRSAALALKLAEVAILEEETKVKPTLLLDEVLSELDENHRELLLKSVVGTQTFITTTSFEVVEKVLGTRFEKFVVKSGVVESLDQTQS